MMTKDNSPFFIIGPPRSGTTLIVQMLNRHSRIFIPPETHFFSFVNGFISREKIEERKIIQPEVLRSIVEGYVNGRMFRFLDIEGDTVKPVLLKNASNYGDIFENLMNYLLKRSGKHRWGEKTPRHLRHVDKIKRYFPGAKFILLVRDGRATIKSHYSHPGWFHNIVFFSKEWLRDAKAMLDIIDSVESDKFFILRYESLLENPEDVVRKLMKFLGETYEESMLVPVDDNENGYQFYTRPWMVKSSMGIDHRRADSWREELAPAQIKLIERLTCKELMALGYSTTNPRALTWPLLYIIEYLRFFMYRLKKKLSTTEVFKVSRQ